MKYSLIFIVCLTLISCSTAQLYKGDKLAPEDVVVIESASALNLSCLSASPDKIKICAFDNVEFDSCQQSIEFLPGEHVFRIEISSLLVLTTHNKEYIQRFEAGGERYCLTLTGQQYTSKPELFYMGMYNKQTKKVDKYVRKINLVEHVNQ